MKKIILLILAVIAVIGIVFALMFLFRKEPPITNYPPKSGTIVAFGDSLVEGMGALSGNDFPAVLGRLIGEPILNMGKSGNTTRDGLNRIDEVIVQNPKIVLVLFGGNDFLRKIPKSETFSNLDKIISELQNSGAIVVLLGVKGGILSDNYKSNFKQLTEDRGTLYVPNVLNGLVGHSKFMDNAIHPNDAGYQKIAEKIYPVLKKALGE